MSWRVGSKIFADSDSARSIGLSYSTTAPNLTHFDALLATMRRIVGRGLRIHDRRDSRLQALSGFIGRGSIASNSSKVEDPERSEAEEVVEMLDCDGELSILERSEFVDDIVLSVSIDSAWTRAGMMACLPMSTVDDFRIDFDCLLLFSNRSMSGTRFVEGLSETGMMMLMGGCDALMEEWAARRKKPVDNDANKSNGRCETREVKHVRRDLITLVSFIILAEGSACEGVFASWRDIVEGMMGDLRVMICQTDGRGVYERRGWPGKEPEYVQAVCRDRG